MVWLVNKNIFDITYQYNAEYQNIYPMENLPFQSTLKGNEKKIIAKFLITGKKFSLENKYKWVLGNKNVYHNNNYLYALPYKRGSTQTVTQGFNGVFSHRGESQYAVDFDLRVGQKVFAARGGQVVLTKSDGKKGGTLKKYYDEANFITIKHDDGTYGKYVHLQEDGVKVKIGQYVKRGEFIGLSGNTGYSNGAHLHFIVFRPKDYKSRVSIPIKFITKEGIVSYLKKGQKLTAVR